MRQVLRHQGDRLLFHTDFAACAGYANGLQAAAQVRCAAHLIVGAEDQMTPPPAARSIAEALRATVVALPGGHSLMQEAPDPALAALRAALA